MSLQADASYEQVSMDREICSPRTEALLWLLHFFVYLIGLFTIKQTNYFV